MTKKLIPVFIPIICTAVLLLFSSGHSATTVKLPSNLSVDSSNNQKDFPQIKFFNEDAKLTNLQSYSGKYLLLVLWSEHCRYCLNQLPALNYLSQQLGGRKFAVLPICIDLNNLNDVKVRLKDHNAENLPACYSNQMVDTEAVSMRGYPLNILIDPQGKEVWRKTGQTPWNDQDIVKHIQEMIE